MRVGLSLHGSSLSEQGARFAAQLGVRDVVVHLTNYTRNGDGSGYLAGGVGPINGECIDAPLWSYDYMAGMVAMLARHGLSIAAMENISPNFWSDILLDGPRKLEQMEAMKGLVRDAGRAGIPVIGYNFSLAGVWGWQRKPIARGNAITAVFAADEVDIDSPLPDGMVGNMRYRDAVAGAAAQTADEPTLWARLEWFLNELVPVAEEAGVRLAAHPDDPPVERLRGTARLVNSHAKYDRLLAIAPSPANALEFCVGSLAEMREGDIYETTRRFARSGAIAYVHFRNVRGKVPTYVETFVDDGDVDMAEIVRVLHEEGFDGVLVPDHVPDLDCAAPWHAGHAYTVGYMKALVAHAAALSAARPAAPVRNPAIAAVAR
ncbi:mannonate dehydratase [Mesorhizobium sp. LHD-90]|uniref:mannonate dehydratase n=1 Tax=Mesorhizobium sp. LHD-90 TaxID=3071414 RepID=UPI0027DF77AC|nr:mannonate dehydratase [Mesorhizobium sp. LHD-90]MDQ6433843.1 mannonate dehydratase [Mesorhizobium sp. LHD-90]